MHLNNTQIFFMKQRMEAVENPVGGTRVDMQVCDALTVVS